MLKTLRIEHFALVDNLEVELGSGLNILTGATGGGKSIIVGAINLVLGERASAEMVRSGSNCAIVEASFEITENVINSFIISEVGIITSGNTLSIRRELSSKGASRCFVNDRLISLFVLKTIGDRLADLHGQHQHQSLLDVSKHIEYLDKFGGLEGTAVRVRDIFGLLKEGRERLVILRQEVERELETKELHSFQLEEIKRANLLLDEEEELLGQKKVLENAEELCQLVSSVTGGLYEDDSSVSERISQHLDELKRAAELDLRLKEHLEHLTSALVGVEETSRSLTKYRGSIEFDTRGLENIRERIDLINDLKRKYGKSIGEILQYARKIEQALKNIVNRAEEVRQKESEIEKLALSLKGEVISLSSKRKKAALRLAKKIEQELSFLGMGRTQFEVRVGWSLDEDGLLGMDGKRYHVDDKGMDRVEFFVSPNPGEEPKPLAKIASGGEISRIMLALKATLARVDNIDTLVFDEIDVGIGGEVAQAVGRKLKRLSATCQVICITHLQQIASQASHHFKVFKEMSGKRMITKIKKLSSSEKVGEIARLISGRKISGIALKQAAQMIEEEKGIES